MSSELNFSPVFLMCLLFPLTVFFSVVTICDLGCDRLCCTVPGSHSLVMGSCTLTCSPGAILGSDFLVSLFAAFSFFCISLSLSSGFSTVLLWTKVVLIFRPNIISAGDTVLLSRGVDLYTSKARWESLLVSLALLNISFTVRIILSMKPLD